MAPLPTDPTVETKLEEFLIAAVRETEAIADDNSSMASIRARLGCGMLNRIVNDRVSYEDLSDTLAQVVGEEADGLTPDVLREIMVGRWPQVTLRHAAMFDDAMEYLQRERDRRARAADRAHDRLGQFAVDREGSTARKHLKLLRGLAQWAKETADLAVTNHPTSSSTTEDALHGVAYAAAVCDVIESFRAFLAEESPEAARLLASPAGEDETVDAAA